MVFTNPLTLIPLLLMLFLVVLLQGLRADH